MWLNPQETADLVAFTGEMFNGNLHFLYSAQCFENFSDSIQTIPLNLKK